ncbi:DUF222 domain-containing protein [Luteimicrobium sp. NPDC057192]|uniref:HNH endonuclease signature motif containing protein n=1 Tax=Luteimicrobium sp. NPDC057192 TaxID=3346042 RepID=UPI0036331900
MADLRDDALVEVAAAAERLRSWALAVQSRAVTELAVRAGGSSLALDGASAVVAARLCLTSRAADLLLGLSAGLDELPEVAEALNDGRIDERRARALVDGVVDVPREDRRALVGPLVGTWAEPGPACRLTAPHVRERVRRVVAAHDPAGAERRRDRARDGRCVTFDPAPDAMAYVTALIPADHAAKVRAHLDRLAVSQQGAADEARTLDQLRADTLVALLTGARPITGPGLAGTARGSSAGQVTEPMAWTSPTVRTVVHVTIAASTLLGLDDAPGDLRGFGPIPAALARELAAGEGVTWQRILTDPATGIATDLSRRTYRPGVVLGEFVRARDATCTFPGCRVPAVRCDLDHVEPFVHPERADRRTEASSPPPGQTRADNLHPVCRRHHNLKTHHGWSTTREPVTGRVSWTAPTGHVHDVGAHVVEPSLLDADLVGDAAALADADLVADVELPWISVGASRRAAQEESRPRATAGNRASRGARALTPHGVVTRRGSGTAISGPEAPEGPPPF